MATLELNDSYPKIVKHEGEDLIILAEVMNKSHLKQEELERFHKVLVNHEIRWRHAIPELNSDAVLGIWEETFVTKDGKMLAKGRVYGKSKAQRKAQALLEEWEEKGKRFGVSSQVWKLYEGKEGSKTKAIIFREASLTPFPKIPTCQVYGIFEESDAGKTLIELLETITNKNGDHKDGIEVISNDHIGGSQPLIVNINVGNGAGAPEEDQRIAEAINFLDKAKKVLESGSPIGGLGSEELAGEAPTPEEFTEQKTGQTAGVPDKEQSFGREEEPSEEDDQEKKRKAREDLKAFEEKIKMDEKDVLIQRHEFEKEQAGKNISDLETSVKKFESDLAASKDKIAEYEVITSEAKQKLTTYEEKLKVVEKENTGYKAKVVKLEAENSGLKLFPIRYKLARLAGNEKEEDIKAFFNEVSDFSEKQLTLMITKFEKRVTQQPKQEQLDKIPSLTGDQDLFAIGDVSSDVYEKMADKYKGNPDGFLHEYDPERFQKPQN